MRLRKSTEGPSERFLVGVFAISSNGFHGRVRLNPWLETLERLAIVAEYDIGASIYRCNDPVEHWFRIVSGAARKSVLTGDGRRHIVDFMLPGDFFGFGASHGRHFSVEAIVPGSVIARYPRGNAERLADCDPQIARGIREVAFESIARLQRRMVILGRTRALEKVSAFLLEMADRSHTAPTHAVYLPISRYDIADYLGMAVETVSRTLTQLRSGHAIAFGAARQVQICNRGALERFADRSIERGAHARKNGSCIRAPRITPPIDMSVEIVRREPVRPSD
jgi:CRP/FNR family transcriptional regulator, nitrogen fixation regulation protein